MYKIKTTQLGLFALTISVLTGCTAINEQSAIYMPEPLIGEKEPLISTLLVERIHNAQPKEETLPFNPNNDPWILIPLCFYSGQKVDPMVKRNFFQNNLEDALQRLFIKDLRAANITNTLINACKFNPVGDQWKDKYRLELILRHAVWNRNLTAYGLSYPGTLLWSIGFPTSYGSVHLEIDAILYSPGFSAKPIGKCTLTKKDTCVEFIYDQIGYQPSVSEKILSDMFPEMAKDLRKFITKTLKKK